MNYLSKQKVKRMVSVGLATVIACGSTMPVFAASNSTGSSAADAVEGGGATNRC